MSKSFKKFLTITFLSGLGYLSYKIYRRIRDAIELEKFLPKFFESHVGEAPEVSLTITFNQTILKAGFSKDTLKKNPDLEQSILDYVNNYYSSFCMEKFKVVLQEKQENAEGKVVEEVKIKEPEKELTAEKIKTPKKEPKKDTVEKVKSSPKKQVRKQRKKKT